MGVLLVVEDRAVPDADLHLLPDPMLQIYLHRYKCTLSRLKPIAIRVPIG